MKTKKPKRKEKKRDANDLVKSTRFSSLLGSDGKLKLVMMIIIAKLPGDLRAKISEFRNVKKAFHFDEQWLIFRIKTLTYIHLLSLMDDLKSEM